MPRVGVKLIAICALWFCASTGIILVNNHIMNGDHFHYPLLISMMGQSFSGTVIWIGHFCGCIDIRMETKDDGLQHLHIANPRMFKDVVLPVAALSALTLGFGNAVYLHLSVAFIQILKAGVPICTLCVMVRYKLESWRKELFVAVFIIAAGCSLSVAGELKLDLLGLLLMLAGEISEAYKLVITQVALQSKGHEKLTSPQALAYISPVTSIFLALAAAILEIPDLRRSGNLLKIYQNPPLYAIASSLGLCVTYLSLLVVKNTSSLTFKIIAQAKNTATVVGGVILYGNIVTHMQWIAYVITIIGFFMYQRAVQPPENGSSHPQNSTNGTNSV